MVYTFAAQFLGNTTTENHRIFLFSIIMSQDDFDGGLLSEEQLLEVSQARRDSISSAKATAAQRRAENAKNLEEPYEHTLF